ncbi:hypothetical protein [Novosphingobium resinovorum]|uniref:hypothetical protein n=1 Tax=Novosphingobium resinovorum TaxID=158500 RepID=UPI002ED47CEA|nr:hypothetical protein [Novosphingobium resinovorum]
MFGRILGAIAGSKVAQHVRGVDGTGAAILGVAATSALRRLGPFGLIAAGLGGYAFMRRLEKRDAAKQVSRPSVMPATFPR